MQAKGTILQLCQVISDLDKSLEHWTQVLGAGPFFVFDVPVLPGQMYRGKPTEVSMRVAFGFSGGLLIELLQQTNDGPSVFKEMIESQGEGHHHVMLGIPYDAGVERLQRHGFEMAYSAQMPTGERFCLFDTRSSNGGYVELVDFSPASEAMLAQMHKAHLAWDGVTNPVRGLEALAEFA